MRIAIVGTGSIGSTFAFHLGRAGHDVTVIARGARLARLERDQAIVLTSGERVAVKPTATLDPATPWDLVLVTVLAHQVDAVMPSLTASAAKTVMFMFNTFEPLDRFRAAVGDARFAWGFPAILATLPDGKLKHQIVTVGQTTISTDAAWAETFTKAGIPTKLEPKMHDWLRTHAALVAPLMAMGCLVHTQKRGVTRTEAARFERAMREAFALVRSLGNEITPSSLSTLGALPKTSVLWALSRTKMIAELGSFGQPEARALIDAMIAMAPERAATLREIRP